ncbi:MAG: cobalamin-binding protein [Rhodospirillaceae bacterium]|nr:cobalamin-binding protein [Rhodospirillaceae bacterium]
MRIVSLICSATEIVAALGHQDSLVGRSHECDFPPGVETLPALTAPRFPTSGNSQDINILVKDLLSDGLSVYHVDADALRKLAPDVIITQDQCDVCAASLADVEAAVCDWTGKQTRIVSCKPENLDDIWTDILTVGAALDESACAEALVASIRERMFKVSQKAQGQENQPSVAMIEWISPLMAAGNWMPTLVGMAGGNNLFGEAGRHSPWMEWEALCAADPDVIIVLPCGFDMDRSEADMPALTEQDGWRGLKASLTGRAYLTDGHQYFNRPGPRVVESLEILAEILHPETFSFGWENIGWRRFVG